MKVGIRKPNIKKSIKAKTTGKAKRAIKKAVVPGYGQKGVGYIKNPKKAVYNKVYNKTTVDVRPDSFKSSTSKTVTENTQFHSKPTTVEMIATIFFGYLGIHKFMNGEIMKGVLYFATLGGFGLLWVYDAYKVLNRFFKSK